MKEEKELELARASDLVLSVRLQMQFDACHYYFFRVVPLVSLACLQGAPSICPHQSAVGALGRRAFDLPTMVALVCLEMFDPHSGIAAFAVADAIFVDL